MGAKRFSLVLCSLMIFCLICPVFCADFVESDSDMFGFAYDDSKVYFTDKVLKGDAISVDSQLLPCSRLYFYIPVPKPLESLDFYFSLIKTTGSVSVSACDYGGLYNNDYHMSASLDLPTVSWMGSNATEGSSARFISFKCSWPSLPFTTSSSLRFIRLTVDYSGGAGNELVLWTQKNLTQGLSGVLGNPTYSFSSASSTAYGSVYAGQFESSGYYITGSKKYKYYNGSSVQTDTLSLTNGTGGTGGYLYVPSHYISPRVGNNPLFKINPFSSSGTLTPSSASQDTDLQGTYLARNYVNTVTMSATRGYSDQELIQAVDDASSLNHQDLQGISDQMQVIVDHMNGLEEQGQQINGSTSQETINNSTSTVSTGSSSLGSMGSTVVSGAQAITNSAGSYIDFVGYGLTSLLAIGGKPNVPLYWAFVAIVFISVSFFVIRRLL